MGLFDRIVRNVTREATRTLTNAVSSTISNAVNDKIRDAVDDKVAPVVNKGADKMADAAGAVHTYGKQMKFGAKLKEILEAEGDYEIKNNISIEALEQSFGPDAYTRRDSRCYAKPNMITYGIYQDGVCKLYIRLWQTYGEYNRVANREVREFCDMRSVPMLDFFDYLPNEVSYVKGRIAQYL